MSNNEWFERGDLLPIGSHLEVTFGNKSVWHECVVLPGKKIAIDRYAGWHVMQWQDDFEFRPIKSEREKAIDDIKSIIVSQGWLSAEGTVSGEIANKIYDAGYRKIEV